MISADLATLAAILGMAGVSFAIRAAGYLVLRRIQPGPFLRAFLGHLPGTLFVAFAAPAIARAGLAGLAGAIATLVVMAFSRSATFSLLAGVGAFWAVRAVGL
ncbi:AzlD family protein [Elioraea sp.]|uniref:AzlD family protein n=1 Tax=Elioraea sp. TaxID=2185103 RepID=UPI0025C295CE|nr:AzlD domain-containing protein [Elioraea sp.]